MHCDCIKCSIEFVKMQQKFLIKAKMIEEIKQRIFEIVEIKLSEQGFNSQALRSIEIALSLEPYYCDLIFSQGIPELIISYNEWHDYKIISNLKIKTFVSIRDKVSAALIEKITTQNQISVSNSLKFVKTPTNIAIGAKVAWNTACAVWHWAGDSSLDYNFYSKRIIFDILYYKALNFYSLDKSLNNIETKNYITNLVNNFVETITKIKNFQFNRLPIFRYFL